VCVLVRVCVFALSTPVLCHVLAHVCFYKWFQMWASECPCSVLCECVSVCVTKCVCVCVFTVMTPTCEGVPSQLSGVYSPQSCCWQTHKGFHKIIRVNMKTNVGNLFMERSVSWTEEQTYLSPQLQMFWDLWDLMF